MSSDCISMLMLSLSLMGTSKIWCAQYTHACSLSHLLVNRVVVSAYVRTDATIHVGILNISGIQPQL